MSARRASQVTAGHDEDDDDTDRDESVARSEQGKGKGGSASQARKAQNRMAQREFRQRKQHYIRDLEARIEVLSGDKEERTDLVMLLVKNLLKENKDLRDLVKNMAGFIGDGLGSCLPRLGLSAPQLDALLNRADTDTAYEAFTNLKASKEMQEANPGIPLGEIRKRTGSSSKRKRASLHVGAEGQNLDSAQISPDEPFSGSSNLPSVDPNRTRTDDPPAPASSTFSTNSFAYLFPDLDAGGANWGRPPSAQPVAAPAPTNYMASWQQAFLDAAARPPASADPAIFNPGLAQTYQTSLVGAQNAFPNFSGFGLTLAGSQPQSFPQNQYLMSGNGPPQEFTLASAPDPASGEPLTTEALNLVVGDPGRRTSSKGTPNSLSNDAEAQRQKQLREAVAHMTANSNKLTGTPLMSGAEVEERLAMQREVMQNLEGKHGVKFETMQLITYHLNNFRVNHAYVLPPSLRPTAVQRSIPHEHAIDGIPIPAVRDRMILLRGRYDLVEAFYGVLDGWEAHGDDPLDHRNWEVSEKWIRDFQILVDDEVYATTNRWRKERGAKPLTRPAARMSTSGAAIAPPESAS